MEQKMIQQVMTAPGKIEFFEVPVPIVKADEVLVKIMNIGICGSDIRKPLGLRLTTKLINL